MTPNMGMAAPKGTQAPQAGLAAIAQPAQAPKGMTSGNMAQIMATARKMSDSQLAEVLQGKSLDVPQYVAMTEAMGRKQLRTAVQGAQAMGQPKQPSIKDKLMAEEAAAQMPQGMPQMPQQPVMAAGGGLMYAGGGAIDMNETANAGGIADLPAPNMEPMTMASGGIVAFDGGGTAYDPNEISMPAPSGVDKRIWEAIKEKFGEWNQPWAPPKGTAEEVRGVMTGKIPAKTLEKEAAAKLPPTINNTPSLDEIAAIRATGAPASAPAAPSIASAPSVAPKKSGLEALLSPQTDSKSAANDYLAQLAGIGQKQRDSLASIKNQGQGEALMNLAAAAFGTGNLSQMLSKGLPMVASTASASRKEQREVEKAANDYDLNLAKYRSAMAEGDKDRAVKYLQLANEDKYHMAMVNKPDSGIAMLNALGDPKLMERYKEMFAVKKGADVVPRATALKEYNDLIGDVSNRDFKKRYPTFDSYYNELSGGTGGGGLDLSAAARAELERRTKR